FRYRSEDSKLDLDAVNTEIRNRLIAEGSFMVSRSNVGGNIVLRMVFANPNITQESLARFIDRVILHGDEISKGLPPAA
ncbi:MAG: hypothetical protein QF531_01060, partial [Candidatus Poseidonia sp.]|nr:hypothetical protein [Poseidonia sp.]